MSDKNQMSTPLKGIIYGAYAFIALFAMIDFTASRLVIPIKRRWSIAKTIGAIVRSLNYLKFLTPAERRQIFIRSAIPTPAQFFDSIPGEKVHNGDVRVERQQSGEHWNEVRKATYERDNYTCQICGVQGGQKGEDVVLQADHIMPKSKGGNDDLENLRTLCRTCHQARHARLF